MSEADQVPGDPAWYIEWRQEAFRQLMAKQGALHAEFGIADMAYDCDLDTGQLTFSVGGIVKVVADIQVAGTTGYRDWRWGWATDHWPAEVAADLQQVVAFGKEHNITELTSASVADDDLDYLGSTLTAVAARVLNTVGAYRASPNGPPSAIFLLIKSIRHVS